jgi:N-acetylmuramoyl-L-alanine amidase
MILEAALICLATNIFHEARGEPIVGQYAVAQVTMRRAKGDPKRVCKEVYRAGQFSWTAVPQTSPQKIDPDAYTKALAIARVVLQDKMPMDFSGGATHYHAVHVRPYWSKIFTRIAQVGNHIFYA